MIGGILPSVAVTVEATESDWTVPLFPGEETLAARVVDKRRRDFTAGRSCARRALARLGWTAVPILAGPQGEPLWPSGVIGSITHCPGYCAATVARKADLRGIGIDAELRAPLTAGVTDLICTAKEVRWAYAQPGDHWPALIFSAKESVYKAWYPMIGRWLDYQDAELTIDTDGGRFRARILLPINHPRFPSTLDGRFALGTEHVFTVVTLPIIR